MNQSINTDSKNSKEPQQKYRLGIYLLKSFAWQSTVIAWFFLLKMVSKMAARLLYV